jgi:N-acyl-D-aspartate/D-glutamate deacylase
MYDLVIRAGRVVDGTGADPRTADVAVTDGVIVEVGRVDGSTRRTVDADGLLVTPGFVDIHTHFDGQATWDPHLTPSCWHGVTTAVMGNCGVGFAPVDPGRHQALIDLMEGVEDIPGPALAEGIRWDWESFPEYLDALDRGSHAIDLGTHVPHAAVRSYVMADRALEDATADDLGAMADIVRDAMVAGALGFSTGRTAGHRDIHGRPVPGTFAPGEELRALMDAVVAGGRGVVQVVPAGVGGVITGDAADAMDTELDMITEVGVATGLPITFLVMQQNGEDVDGWRPWFEAVRVANGRGANIRPQVGDRCFGVLMGHQSRLNPFRYRPSYQAIADLPLAERVAVLRDPATKARILAEHADRSGPFAMDRFGPAGFANLFPLGDALDYEPSSADSVAAMADRAGRDVWDVAYDVLLGSDGREFLLLPLLNYGGGSYDGLLEMMRDPISLNGLGDGGAHVGLVCDASMTTYMLSHWARDRSRGEGFTIAEAVRRVTSEPASFYGMTDRGVIAPGTKADLNLIDFDRLRLLHPEQVHDLPADAGRLIQRADGYVSTIVAGQEVVAEGELTDARPGRLVRRASAAS